VNLDNKQYKWLSKEDKIKEKVYLKRELETLVPVIAKEEDKEAYVKEADLA
jgi:hypothetical protein